MSEQSHRSDPRILNRRTLARDHHRLVPFLSPGMQVLDVGCGTGAITAGIARMVGPEGRVVGLDRDATLVAAAREEHQGVRNLVFECGDVLTSALDEGFDIVTAARSLQWMNDPALALARMKATARPGGCVVALDYNHEDNSWDPAPPPEFVHFYRAFLAWRRANNWDNQIADRLPALFRSAGVSDIQIYRDDETAERGDAGFAEASVLWAHAAQSIGPAIVDAGFLTPGELLNAVEQYTTFVQVSLRRQTLAMRTVAGRVGN